MKQLKIKAAQFAKENGFIGIAKEIKKTDSIETIIKGVELVAGSLKFIEDRKREYEVTDKIIYFNNKFEVCKASKRVMHGLIVDVFSFPNIKLVKHDEIEGSCISLLYKNVLFYFDENLEKQDEIRSAIRKIERDGLKNILAQAEKFLYAA